MTNNKPVYFGKAAFALGLFAASVLYAYWDLQRLRFVVEIDSPVSRQLVLLPFGSYDIYLVVDGLTPASANPDPHQRQFREINAANPMTVEWRIQNRFGMTLSHYAGTTADWHVYSPSTLYRDYPDLRGSMLFGARSERTPMRALPWSPLLVSVSVPSMGAFEGHTAYLAFYGRRDDGFGFYLIFHGLIVGTLGLFFLFALFIDTMIWRQERRR